MGEKVYNEITAGHLTSLEEYRDFYNKIYWPGWEDPHEDFNDLGFMFNIYPRLQWVFGELARNNYKTVLDTGCGQGDMAIPLAKMGYEVTALDISRYIISIARKKAREFGAEVNFKTSSIEKFSSGSKFDAVICFAVIEHVISAEKMMDKLESFVKPDSGTIYMTFPLETGGKRGHIREFRNLEKVRAFLKSRNSRNIFCADGGRGLIFGSYQLK